MQDGFYLYDQIQDCLNKDFASERELCDFVEMNIHAFTRDVLNAELVDYKREFGFLSQQRRYKNGRRIDFLLKLKDGRSIGIECKHPHFISELSNAVGQCLGYFVIAKALNVRLDRIVILSTKPDFILPDILNEFNIPIDFIMMDKSKHITYLNGASTDIL